MTAPTFYMWLANHFIPHLSPAKPVVLLFDSANCHIDLETFELANKNQVYLYALLKNATHLNQPADVGVFGAMKQSWYKNVRQYSRQNPNTDINKKNFCYVFKNTWVEVMRPSLLIDAFRKSGIYPINRQQISNDQVKTSVVYRENKDTPLAIAAVQPSLSYNKSQLDAAMALSSLSASVPNISDQPEVQDKSAPSDIAEFEVLENTLQTPVKQMYRRRMEESYDLPGSPAYRAWKVLYTSVHTNLDLPNIPPQVLVTQEEPTTLKSVAETSVRASSVLGEILTYPSAENVERRKTTNKSLPNFLNSDASMTIMRDDKLKKARELAAKQKKLREKEEGKERRKKEQEEKKDSRRKEQKEKKESRRKEQADKKRKVESGKNAPKRRKTLNKGDLLTI